MSDPIDGITLILELLRSIQLNDSNQQIKVTPANHRRALLDENSCLQCLQYCLRCEETTRRLAMSSAGLFTLAVCIMSSVSKSRILALEVRSYFSIFYPYGTYVKIFPTTSVGSYKNFSNYQSIFFKDIK